jgi:hypothetical protein
MTREWSMFLVVVALAIVGDLWRGGRAPEPVPSPEVELIEDPFVVEEEPPQDAEVRLDLGE